METLKLRSYINDSSEDFAYLIELYRKFIPSSTELQLDFSQCRFLRPNAVVLLGGLIRLIQDSGRTVSIICDKNGNVKVDDDRVRNNLEHNGFLQSLGLTKSPVTKANTVPFREDREFNKEGYIKYLTKEWLKPEWIDVDNEVRNHIISNVLEIYVNVFDHADSPTGVISCGQRFPNQKQLTMCITDFGVGIPHNVRVHLKKPDMLAKDTLHWAFQPQMTTKKQHVSRGLGLKSLKKFITENNGKLEIYSDNGYVSISKSQEVFDNKFIRFKGTIVYITIPCSKQSYTFYNDIDSNTDWF